MANEYLKRTPTSTGNRKVFTFSAWVKRNSLTNGAPQSLFTGGIDGNDRGIFDFDDIDVVRFGFNNSSTWYVTETTDRFRDSGSWMNVIISVDLSISDDDAVSIYVNGIKRSRNSVAWPSIVNNVFNAAGYGMYVASTYGQTNQMYSGEMVDVFWIDGQALTPDVFGFYKDGNGYISAGSTQATDFRPGQWVPKTPRIIKAQIERNGGFGVNGFYLPMNDSSNFGADFHTTPNSIITLKGEDLPQPRNGAPTTTDSYVSQLRTDPYAANLVLAVPGISGGQGSGYGDYSADIKGSGSNKTVTANGDASVAVTPSYYGSALSFDGSGDYFSQTYDADFNFNTDDFTLEMWVYPNTVSSIDGLFAVSGGGGGVPKMVFHLNSGTPSVHYNGLTGASDIYTASAASIPAGQWSHLAYTRKGTTWTWYINGVATGTGSNSTVITFTSQPYYIGYGGEAYFDSFDGKMQDLRVYKGVAKYKGGFDVPRPYTPVGIATWRAVPDCTANNFATLNPVSPASDTTFTNGNLTIAYGSNATRGVVTGTVGIAVTGGGKYYWENRIDASSTSPTNAMIGVWGMSTSTSAANYPGFTNTYGWSYYGGDGTIYSATGGAISNPAYGASYTTGDIISVTLDMTASNGTLTFYKNGVSQGVATTGLGTFLTNGNVHALMPALGDGSSAQTYTVSTNFGQNPTFSGNTTAGTFTDSNGKGLFKYEPPSGFLALCEDNLPTPAIKNPGEHFKTVLYTGDNSEGRSITGVGFKPDLIWFKARNSAASHVLNDTVRGVTAHLNSDSTAAESIPGFPYLNSVNSDGFSLRGSSSSGGNVSGRDYVAWCWRAGAGTTSTNTDGTIPSVVSVNQDAGFSIVSWTAANPAGQNTLGHGLGKTPKFIIAKSRTSGVDHWVCYHNSLGKDKYILLSSTAAAGSSSNYWSTSEPNSTIFGVVDALSSSNNEGDMIAYCWAEIEGFSKFGSYVGNGSADGPFVYCGFKPAFVMLKASSTTGNWCMIDNARNSTNPTNFFTVANAANNGDDTGGALDFLSNGFKLRLTSSNFNGNGVTYIFAAFAESPFTTANAK